MIRGFMTTVAVVGVAVAAGGAFYNQTRHADATPVISDVAPAAAKGDRLPVTAQDHATVQQVLAAAGPEGRILRAHAKAFAANAQSRFVTVALPGGQHTTVLARVPAGN
ncbi:MAG TPA: hypothetical protein VHD15_01055 [Hyphomicrobiales bacterium]|nr:hypothetical protein [Hyphomicrobiales bacterium]